MLLARTEEEKPQEGRDEIFFSPTRFFLVGLFGEFCPHVAVWKEEEEGR